MTGGGWINLLYEGLNERDMVDSLVTIEEMRELLVWAEGEGRIDNGQSFPSSTQRGH